jgi:CHAD domain-containing protein
MPPVSHSEEQFVAQEKKAGLAHWANRVLQECDNTAAAFAADPVHDLRVAIRRCRSMADGFLSVDPDPAWKQMKRLAKPLFSSLGDLRDTQVMMDWVAKLSPANDPLGVRLSEALAIKEAALKRAAEEALARFDRKRWASLNAHLAKRTGRIPLEGPVFQHLALERWTEARDMHRRALRNRSSVAYHQLRIGIKRFRYTAENFLPERHAKWAKDLRQLQDALGDVHDLDVLRAMVRARADAAADERALWLKRISEERQRRLQPYRGKTMGRESLWSAWREELPKGSALEEAALAKLRTWASFLAPDTTHASRVAAFALQLFDGIPHCGTLPINATCRRILEAAALLHEVGRKSTSHGREGGHQKRGERLILKLKPPLGWSEEEMCFVAALVRYHRADLPLPSISSLSALSARQRSDLMPIIGMLRLANAFDEDHEGSITGLRVECRNGWIVIYGEGLRRFSRLAERIARARYLLETTLGLPIMVRPARAKTSSARHTFAHGRL